MAPLSNGNTALLADLARYAGLPFDTILGADVFQHYKPDPETYLGACRLMSAPPERVKQLGHRGEVVFDRKEPEKPNSPYIFLRSSLHEYSSRRVFQLDQRSKR